MIGGGGIPGCLWSRGGGVAVMAEIVRLINRRIAARSAQKVIMDCSFSKKWAGQGGCVRRLCVLA